MHRAHASTAGVAAYLPAVAGFLIGKELSVMGGALFNPARPFVSILGAEAGNLALKVLATGGVYLGGGIPLRILHSFEQPRFLDAFRSKGRLEHLMRDMPIHIITNPKVGLMGAAYRGMDLWG